MEENLTEIEKVKVAATQSRHWTVKSLIDSAKIINPAKSRPYSFERIYQMLREDGNEWVTNKLVNFAASNPKA